MIDFTKYKKRVGMSKRPNTNALIDNSIKNYNLGFETSSSYYEAEINDEVQGVIIHQTKYPEFKELYFKTGYTPQKGSVIKVFGKTYLLLYTDKNAIYATGRMEECNNTLTIQSGEPIKKMIGRDHLGRPIYETTYPEIEIPCIVRDRYYSTNDNAQLPLPEGKLDIDIGYVESPSLDINNEIKMYGKTYKISDTSYVQTENKTGIIKIHAERREGGV